MTLPRRTPPPSESRTRSGPMGPTRQLVTPVLTVRLTTPLLLSPAYTIMGAVGRTLPTRRRALRLSSLGTTLLRRTRLKDRRWYSLTVLELPSIAVILQFPPLRKTTRVPRSLTLLLTYSNNLPSTPYHFPRALPRRTSPGHAPTPEASKHKEQPNDGREPRPKKSNRKKKR